MVQVDLQWLKGSQFFDANGDPLSGGKLYFFDTPAGPTRTTYSDADGTVANPQPVVLDSGGYLPVSVYIQVGRWDFRLDDQNDVTVYSEQNIQGALDAEALQVVSARPELPVINVTANYVVSAADLGGTINADPTGGDITITLLSAATAGDGKTLNIKHVGTANTVTIAPVANQTIDSASTHVLTRQYDQEWIVSDGANWHVIGESRLFAQRPFPVVERRSSPPASFNPGDNFIIANTPAGDWASFAEHDVVRASGTGLWQNFTPPPDGGWQAYVQNENVNYQFQDSAWVAWSNISAPPESDLRAFSAQYQVASGSGNGGSVTASTWNRVPLGVILENSIPGLSLDTATNNGRMTIPEGVYEIEGFAVVRGLNGAEIKYQIRLENVTDGATVSGGASIQMNSGTSTFSLPSQVYCTVTVPAGGKDYELQVFADKTSVMGTDVVSGVANVYGSIKIIDRASLQGTQGSPGPQGSDGAPGSSDVTGTSATSNTIGTGSKTWTVVEANRGWDEGARIRATSRATPSQDYQSGVITTYAGSTLTVNIDYVPDGAAAGPFTDWNFNLEGDPGTDGAQGAVGPTGANLGLDYAWRASTGGGAPSNGELRTSIIPANEQPATLYISKTDRNGLDQTTEIMSWGDSSTTANRGQLSVKNTDVAKGAQAWKASITGAPSDQGTYFTIPITFTSAAAIDDTNIIGALFSRTGDKGIDGAGAGDVVGPSSATDNSIARYLGTTGKQIDEAPTPAILNDDGSIDQFATSATRLPTGTTAQRPGDVDGRFRLNLNTGQLEFNLGGSWISVAALPIKNADFDNMVEATVKGRPAGAGSGTPVDLTATQLMAILDTLSNKIARLDSVQTFTKGQKTGVTALATWTTPWNIDDNNNFRITGLVSGAAGNFPLPTVTGLAANQVWKGEVKMNTQAGTTAGFVAGWEWPGGSAGIPDLSTGGHWTLYIRIENDGSTTHYEIASVAPWATA